MDHDSLIGLVQLLCFGQFFAVLLWAVPSGITRFEMAVCGFSLAFALIVSGFVQTLLRAKEAHQRKTQLDRDLKNILDEARNDRNDSFS
ncbi:MAG: hypothetical protein ACLFPX_05160 [Candidatus Omnitrophota bacterium]